MIRKDYIIRLIEEFAAVLARIVRMRTSSRLYEAHLTVLLFAKRVFPNYETLLSANDEELLSVCSLNQVFEPELCRVLGLLASEEASLLHQMGSPNLAHERALLALRCLHLQVQNQTSMDDSTTLRAISEVLQPALCTKFQLATIADLANHYGCGEILRHLYSVVTGVPPRDANELNDWRVSLTDI